MKLVESISVSNQGVTDTLHRLTNVLEKDIGKDENIMMTKCNKIESHLAEFKQDVTLQITNLTATLTAFMARMENKN